MTKGYVWQIVTYMFLHGSLWHLILNMFIIWMFGTPLESVWGSNRFLNYYFVCGLGGALLSFLFSFNTTVIGASGAGYGILLAYAILFPYSEIYVWGLFPVRARTLVIFMVIIEFASGISGGDGIAHFAHLGGMAAGFIYLKGGRGVRRFFQKIRSGRGGTERRFLARLRQPDQLISAPAVAKDLIAISNASFSSSLRFLEGFPSRISRAYPRVEVLPTRFVRMKPCFSRVRRQRE